MEDIVGKTESEAREILEKEGKILRVVDQSGDVTCDFNPFRLNVIVENGIVTKIIGIK